VAQRTSHSGATDALEQLDTRFERLADWVSAHRLAVGVAVAAVLVAGGAWELVRTSAERREAAASDELDRVQTSFLIAMGAEPGALDVPKLANPEAEKRIRAEYADQYRAVAEAHPGSVAAALAWLEVAGLLDPKQDPEGVLGALQKSLAEQSGNQRLAGLVHQRIAQLEESRGDLAAAAAEHEAAGALPDFPLRFLALADAARCYAQAGQPEKALPLLERVESEGAAQYTLPAHLRSLLRELRTTQAAQSAQAPEAAEPAP
jgi:hypothetical protein